MMLIIFIIIGNSYLNTDFENKRFIKLEGDKKDFYGDVFDSCRAGNENESVPDGNASCGSF